ncbi:hypothetical protein RJT34_11696 [Clitoria ternatea]|uniref:Uncharacterized protein n=1 Tax=Clitoria ternatea TaxID=43366 RepID=A0AAN9PIN6_CLITE
MPSTVEEEHLDYDSDLKNDKRSHIMRQRHEASDKEHDNELHHSVERLDTTLNTVPTRLVMGYPTKTVSLPTAAERKEAEGVAGKEREQMVFLREGGEVAKKLNFRVMGKMEFAVRMLGDDEGRKGKLTMKEKVFEVAPEVAKRQ